MSSAEMVLRGRLYRVDYGFRRVRLPGRAEELFEIAHRRHYAWPRAISLAGWGNGFGLEISESLGFPYSPFLKKGKVLFFS